MGIDCLVVPLVPGTVGVVQGGTGFGFGPAGLARTSDFIHIKDTSVARVPAALTINAVVLVRLPEHLGPRRRHPVYLGRPAGWPPRADRWRGRAGRSSPCDC